MSFVEDFCAKRTDSDWITCSIHGGPIGIDNLTFTVLSAWHVANAENVGRAVPSPRSKLRGLCDVLVIIVSQLLQKIPIVHIDVKMSLYENYMDINAISVSLP